MPSPSTDPSAERGLSWLEIGFFAISIALLNEVLDAPLETGLAVTGAVLGVPIKRLLLVPTFVGSAILALQLRPALRAAARELWPTAALVALAMMSALWSPLPGATAAWSLGLAGTALFGVVLALRFDGERQLQLVAVTLASVVLASVVGPAFVAGPSPGGFGARDGFWVGFFYDNNLFGRIAALSALVSGVLAVVSNRGRAMAVAVSAAAGLVLHGTGSLTSELALGAGLTVTALLSIAQRLAPPSQRRLLVAAAVASLLCAAAVLADPQRLLLPLGKSPDLSGRVQIWNEVAARIAQRPWLGSGYGAFWAGIVGDPRPGRHAHNGFLDLTAELGLIGLLLFAVPFVLAIRRAVRAALTERCASALWPPAYFAFFAVMNLAESCLVRHKLTWALYVAALLWQAPRRYRSRA